MNKGYSVMEVFNEDGQSIQDILCNFLVAFLDKEFNAYENNDIKDINIISNLSVRL